MASIKKNIFYSLLLTTTSYLMSLVVFPYVSRTLGPSSLGLVSFAESTVGLFATTGMNFLGIREIARSRNDREKLSIVYSNLLILSLILALIGICGFILCAILIPNLHQHPQLIMLGILSILTQIFLIEWFYKGLENFKYITIRNLVVKITYIFAVFLFVKDPSNYLIYFALIVATYLLNSIINIFHSRKFAKISLRGINLRSYIKPYLSLATYTILTSLYLSFNPMFLGATTNDAQVGYYSVSVKVFIIIFNSFTAITTALMPNMSVLAANNELRQLKDHTRRTLDIFTLLSVPLTILGIYYSPQIVNLISGDAYNPAIIPMKILMPLLFINGYAQIINTQFLMTLSFDKHILRNSKIVATIIILLNILLVPTLGAIGSAIVWTTCELIMLILSQQIAIRQTKFNFLWKPLVSSLIATLPGIIIIMVCSNLPINQYIQPIIGGCIFFVLYIIIQFYVIKNESCIYIVTKLCNRRDGRIT